MEYPQINLCSRNYPDMVVFHIKREPVEEPDEVDVCSHHPEDEYPDVNLHDMMDQEEKQTSDTTTTLPEERKFMCPGCGSKYARRYHLLRHQKNECGVPMFMRPFECDACGYRTSRKSSVLRHIQRVHCGVSAGAYPRVVVPRDFGPPAEFACDGCRKSYPLSEMLDKHRQFECGQEGFLAAWIETAPPPPLYLETIAATDAQMGVGKTSPTIDPKDALRIYKETIAASGHLETVLCPKCSRTFTRKDSLRRHLMRTCNPPVFFPPPPSVAPATPRPRSYDTSSPLRVACDRCSKTFANKDGLKAHQKLTCEQPPTLACQHCPYLGRLKHHLVSHIANNHPEEGGLPPKPARISPVWRPFPCLVCNKSYKYKTDLARHVRHSCGQNPVFACPRCPKRYRHQFGLDRHVSLECGVEPAHPCPHCAYRAKRPFSLVSHLRNRHPEFAQ